MFDFIGRVTVALLLVSIGFGLHAAAQERTRFEDQRRQYSYGSPEWIFQRTAEFIHVDEINDRIDALEKCSQCKFVAPVPEWRQQLEKEQAAKKAAHDSANPLHCTKDDTSGCGQ